MQRLYKRQYINTLYKDSIQIQYAETVCKDSTYTKTVYKDSITISHLSPPFSDRVAEKGSITIQSQNKADMNYLPVLILW